MNRKGLTLIEVLVAVGIIAVLTAITVPRFTDARERTFIAAMESDLGQLQMRQELHRRTGDRQYADELDELERFQPSSDVAITLDGDGSTWSAEAQHRGTSRTCAFDSSVGEIECTGRASAPFPESGDDGDDGSDNGAGGGGVDDSGDDGDVGNGGDGSGSDDEGSGGPGSDDGSGDTGDDTGDTGDDTGDTGDDTGDTGNTGDTGDDTGGTGDDSGGTGDDTGGTGDDSGGTGDDDSGNGDGNGNGNDDDDDSWLPWK